jgi:hypothetical protein
MRRFAATALLMAVSVRAPAQSSEPPPPPDDERQAPRRPVTEMGYYDACFGVPRIAPGPGFGIYGEIPIYGGGPISSPGPSLPVPSASGDDKAWLILAVLAAAALPVVVYAIDSPPSRIVMQRFRCPTFSLDLIGGGVNGPAGGSGFLTTRIGFGVEHVAADLEFEQATSAVNGFATHLLLRPTPRAHIEGGLAIGYRRNALGGSVQDGLEIGLPHRYVLWREELSSVALEVRPMLMIGSHVEPSLEGALLFPLAQVLQLRLGGRVYTFNGNLLTGLSLGFSLVL